MTVEFWERCWASPDPAPSGRAATPDSGELVPMTWAWKHCLCPPTEEGMLQWHRPSSPLNWSIITSILSMSCSSVRGDESSGKLTTEFPRLRTTVVYPRGILVKGPLMRVCQRTWTRQMIPVNICGCRCQDKRVYTAWHIAATSATTMERFWKDGGA